MRNLKRALSLALASVMLLGMMVVGSSAAFSDADEIVNKEAVEITAGLGLFAGSDGKFNPTGTVTRAQMATVIAKMLYGSEINADQFKGTGKFSDTVSFEGGWAEGYISLCANLGIVGGYGDGTFKPGQAVTTAEAVTMIINALKVDAGEGTWPLTVMAKAEEMKLFDELAVKPGTNVALTRDQLASIVLEGIKYSPKDVSGYTIPGSSIVFEELGDAVIANGNKATGIKEVVGEDALYRSVFDVNEKSGFVTANQATDKDAKYTVIGGKPYNIETGADMIGHYVTVYFQDEYKSEKEPGVTYCIVDESTIVEVEEDIVNDRVAFRDAFGVRNIDQVTDANGAFDVMLFDGTMNRATIQVQDTVMVDDDNDPTTPDVEQPAVWDDDNDPSTPDVPKMVAVITWDLNDISTYNYGTYNATAGKYVIYDNEIVAYVAPSAVTATKVTKVTTTAGKETISVPGTIWQNNATDDEVVAYEGIAKDDIITYVQTGNIYHLTKATTVEGQVASISQNKDNMQWIMTVNGTKYEYFNGTASAATMSAEGITLLTSEPANFNFSQTYTLYLTPANKLIGYAAAAGASADISDVIYVADVYTTVAQNAYGLYTQNTYAQGVDMEGKEVNILLDVAPESTPNAGDYTTVLTDAKSIALAGAVTAKGFYTFAKVNDSKGAKEGIMTGTKAPAVYSNVTVDANNDGVNESAPVFHLAGKTFGDTKDRLDAESKYVLTSGSDNAFFTTGTKFIMIAGTGTKLETGMTVGSVNYLLTNANDFQLLLTEDASHNKIVEAMIINVANVTVDSDPYYVSANQINNKETTLDGYLYEVYNAKTGEKETLTMATSGTLPAGFYDFEYDADDKQYTLTGAADAGIISFQTTFKSFYNGMLTTVGGSKALSNIDASEAIVVDIRTEKQLEKSDIEEVTSIDDIVYLVTEESKTIVLDIIHDVKEEKVIAIYVAAIN